MAFPSRPTTDIEPIGSGIAIGRVNTILSTTVFEDGLVPGRFAKLDTGSIDNLDASEDPVIAGLVLRPVTNNIEAGNTIDSSVYPQANYMREGIGSVDVKSGETPTRFGKVYAFNAAGDDLGKAVTSDTTAEATNAEFLEEVDADVWSIRLI